MNKCRVFLTVVLSGLLGIFATFNAQGQHYNPLHTHYAATAGLNAASLSINPDRVLEKYGRISFHLGGIAMFPITKDLYYRQELTLSLKGGDARYSQEDAFFSGTKNYNLTYLDAPAMIQYNFLNVLNVHGGGYFSYLLGAGLDYNGDHTMMLEPLTKSDLSAIDYGAVLGAGITFDEIIEFGVRYNYGLRDLAETPNAVPVLENAQNRLLQFYANFWISEFDKERYR